MCLSVSDHVVSAVLLKDQEVQHPVYYISKTLVDVETRYLPLEKLVLALVHATRKSCPITSRLIPYTYGPGILYNRC